MKIQNKNSFYVKCFVALAALVSLTFVGRKYFINNDKIVNDERAILKGNKIERLANDSSTVVFYSVSEKNLPKKWIGGGRNSFDSVRLIPADKMLEQVFLGAVNDAKTAARLRFFDFDKLSRDDLEMLNKLNVKVPAISDFKLCWAEHKYKDGTNFVDAGRAVRLKSGMKVLKIDVAVRDNEMLIDDMDRLVTHEFGHCLGEKHPFKDDTEEGPNKNVILKKSLDSISNTILSYNPDSYLAQFHGLDTRALQKMYLKPSGRAADSVKQAHLQIERDFLQDSDSSYLGKKVSLFYKSIGEYIDSLSADKISIRDIESIKIEINKALKNIFSPEELRMLGQTPYLVQPEKRIVFVIEKPGNGNYGLAFVPIPKMKGWNYDVYINPKMRLDKEVIKSEKYYTDKSRSEPKYYSDKSINR